MNEEEVIECYLPSNPSIEAFFSFSNPEKIKIIQLGLSLYNQGMDTIKFWNNSDWEKKIQCLKDEKSELNEFFEKQILKLNHQIKCNLSDFKREKESLSEKIQDDYESRYKNQISSLRETINELTHQLSCSSDKYNNLYQTLDDKFQNRLKEQNDRSDSLILSLREEIKQEKLKYEQQLIISQNSTLKGQQGEEQICTQLNLLFPSAEILDTHSETGRGDFIVKKEGIVFMVENKNYSKNVQKSEIDKFYRDLERDSNNDIHCAVLVSLHTGICGREDFEFEVRNNKPILFLHKLSHNFTNLDLAFKFFKLIINQKNIDLNSKEIASLFKNMANNIKRNFKKLKKQLDKFHSDQTETLLQNETNILDLYKIMKLDY
tara:strand:- start:1596 stop:2723 length:1128 start_codon:yes stop_codon:yes gene_type:complete